MQYGTIAIVITALLVGVSYYSSVALTGRGQQDSSLSSSSSSITKSTSSLRSTSLSSTVSSSSTNSSSSSISSCNYIECIIATLKVGGLPYNMAYDSSNGDLYVTNGAGYVTVINSVNMIVANITSGFSGPGGIALDPSNGNIYIANSELDSVTVVNGSTNEILGHIFIGCYTDQIVFDPLNNYLYTSDMGDYAPPPKCSSETVSVIDAATNMALANISGILDPTGFAMDSLNGNLYVGNGDCAHPMAICGNVSVIDTRSNKIVDQVEVGFTSQNLVFDPTSGYVYVDGVDNTGLAVINGTTDKLVNSIDLGSIPAGMTFDFPNGFLYVTSPQAGVVSGSVFTIDSSSNQVVGNMTVGVDPISTAFDSTHSHLFVANHDSGTVSVIAVNAS